MDDTTQRRNDTIRELYDTIRELQDTIRKWADTTQRHEDTIRARDDTIRELRDTINGLVRRLNFYENPHSPSSKDSIPTMQKKAKTKKSGSGAPAPHKKKPGRKNGHPGVSHDHKPTSTEEHMPEKCTNCGSSDIEHGPAKSKTITEIEFVPRTVTTNHLTYPTKCNECGHEEEAAVYGIPGTSFGLKIAEMITKFYLMPASLYSIRGVLEDVFKFITSKASIQHGLMAIARLLKPFVEKISQEMSESEFIHLDETTMPVDGKRCFTWMATGKKNGKVNSVLCKVVDSRGGKVLDEHFPYGHIPATVDGYKAYQSRFPILQRCWPHILREAERLAGKGRQYHQLYVRLKGIYHRAKMAEPDENNIVQYDAFVDETMAVADEYTRLQCPFGATLAGAAPSLFTFLLHPGMEPTNNLAERNIKPTVISRKIRHSLKTEDGMEMFSILMTCYMTCKARGQSMSDLIKQLLLESTDNSVGAK